MPKLGGSTVHVILPYICESSIDHDSGVPLQWKLYNGPSPKNPPKKLPLLPDKWPLSTWCCHICVYSTCVRMIGFEITIRPRLFCIVELQFDYGEHHANFFAQTDPERISNGSRTDSLSCKGGARARWGWHSQLWHKLWLHFFWPTFWLHCILYRTLSLIHIWRCRRRG